ncbi:MAG: monofunctional biosynthetic peptidoglycan transglycosylase [Balneolaceae bacterium]|nr:monofunctional biosynthetic peptidoglycan transglycosylase [Balneolaceae bacterium]MBO6546374.1 monofunctional biosynthetic peptidoglycan transglycosylase [Balneolaceae bacterium]MBO6648733.1 monofunctional biosynthetic peptidoglycan transglycosylase [Balneolaceae bacterium]
MDEYFLKHNRKKFSVKKGLKIFSGLAIGYTFWFLLIVLSLRWINPGFTSFTLQEDWKTLNAERYSLRSYWIDYDQLPENIKWAVVASEDQRFWSHPGLDFDAIKNALEEMENGERVRGASTISQQVSKNLFLSSRKSYLRKGIEAGITFTIEALWTKERILEVYLNIVEFGPGVYGIGKASEHFFSKPAIELTNDEAARMAAVLPNPKRMKVEPPTPYVAERKDWILRNMMQLSGIAYLKEKKSSEENVASSFSLSRSNEISYETLKPKMWVPVEDTAFFKSRLKLD